MNILLTGATGFTGSHLLDQMLAAGIQPRCLVRASSAAAALRSRAVEIVTGDIGDAESLAGALRGIDALVNTASIGFGHAPVLVEAAERAGVRRAIFVSTTAIFTKLDAKSKAIRLAAEERIRTSKLAWTIVRPTMIYGTDRDRNMSRLIRYLNRWPAIPVIGDGERLQQPVYVDDVAGAVLGALREERTIGGAYNVAGAQPVTFNQMIDTIARMLDRRVRKLHLPVAPVLRPLQWIERTGVRLPVRSEQILRLNEDKAFDYADAARDFGYAPLAFEEGVRREIVQMGLGGK